jgi:hypothetical protein
MMQSMGREQDPSTILGTREHAALLTQNRHPGVQDAMQWLTYSHLPAQLQRYSAPFYLAAADIVTEVSDSPELTTSLNLLIQAKDSAVRAGIKTSTGRAGSVPRPQEVVDPPLFEGGAAVVRPRPIRDNPQA